MIEKNHYVILPVLEIFWEGNRWIYPCSLANKNETHDKASHPGMSLLLFSAAMAVSDNMCCIYLEKKFRIFDFAFAWDVCAGSDPLGYTNSWAET
jgi:hypothetical protein